MADTPDLAKPSSILQGRGGGSAYVGISASGNTRQHNGNVINTNNYAYQYTLRKRRSDETLRESVRDEELLKAAASGHTPRVQHLITLGTNRDFTDGAGLTALHHAVLSGYEDTTGILIQAGWDIDRNSDLGTPLALAAFKGRAKIMNMLFQGRASIDASCDLLGSALHAACLTGDTGITQAILDRGADVNRLATIPKWLLIRKDLSGVAALTQPLDASGMALDAPDNDMYELPPIAVAAFRDHSPTIKLLCNHQALVDCTCRRKGSKGDLVVECTALAIAASRGHLQTLRTLIECGANVNHQDSVGGTAIFYATSAGHDACVQELLSARTDIHIRPSREHTVLHYAARCGTAETVNMLVAAGLDPNIVDNIGSSPLHSAAEDENKAVIDALIAKGVNPDVVDKWGDTPLHLAAWHNNTAAIEALIAKGAKVNSVCSADNQWTPLHAAAAVGALGSIQCLLRAGAGLEVRDKHRRTPLHTAAFWGNAEAVEALLLAGAFVEGDHEGFTALRLASHQGHIDCVIKLIDGGSNINAKDDDGFTPIISAAYNQKAVVVSFLARAGADTTQLVERALWRADEAKDWKQHEQMKAVAEAIRRGRLAKGSIKEVSYKLKALFPEKAATAD